MQLLWPYVRRRLGLWLFSFAAALSCGICVSRVPRVTGLIFDELAVGRPPSVQYLGWLIGLSLGVAVSTWATRRGGPVGAREVVYELRRDVFAHLLQLDQSFHQRMRPGELMSMLSSDLAAVESLLGLGIVGVANIGCVLGSLLLSLALTAPTVGVPTSLFALAVLALSFRQFRVSLRRSAHLQEKQAEATSHVHQTVSGIRTVKAYGFEGRQAGEFKQYLESARRAALDLAHVEGRRRPLAVMCLQLVLALMIIVGARVTLGEAAPTVVGVTIGGFVAYVSYVAALEEPLSNFADLSNIFLRGIASIARLQRVMAARPMLVGGEGPARRLQLQREIVFEHVGLVTEGRTLLRDVSFTLPAGRVIGITGPIGSGKSLITRLLARLQDPTSGCVLVDGHDLRSLPLASVRDLVALVPQDVFLFADSIAENIAFGLTDGPPDLERVRWAARVAGLDKDIQQFPAGYDTVVGERGQTLSGGQKQRVALARGIARESPLVVLDDALSAVDAETEAGIVAGLKDALNGRTLVMISHRVTALRGADEILVLDEGRISERGTHDELLGRGGFYAQIAGHQRAQPKDPLHGDAALELKPAS